MNLTYLQIILPKYHRIHIVFFSSANENTHKIDHILEHKTNLS